jgi:hypothetical protein
MLRWAIGHVITMSAMSPNWLMCDLILAKQPISPFSRNTLRHWRNSTPSYDFNLLQSALINLSKPIKTNSLSASAAE